MPVMTTSVRKYQQCIDACIRCMQICNECLSSCLQEPDAKARANCIKTLRVCADVCMLSAQAMSMDSAQAKAICSLCRTICDACAMECKMFKDDHCQDCAKVCKECAEECARMSSM